MTKRKRKEWGTMMYYHWTYSSNLCYQRRCICAGCENEEICSRQEKDKESGLTPMKYAVLLLFAKFGAPKRRDYELETNGNDDN